ncbi:MAG: S49 family peptidase [Methylocella sp.]
MNEQSALPTSSISAEMLLCHTSFADKLATSFAKWQKEPKAFETFTPAKADRMRGEPSSDRYGAYRIENGVALIPISGMLIPSGDFLGSIWGMTSQEGLRSEISRAADDPNVTEIALLIDSPGGYASGTDSTASVIQRVRTQKPVTAVVNGMACSGAYWLAAQANKIIASPISEVGSIGVISTHSDMSSALKSFGLKISMIFSGKKKADGNPYEPLSDSAKADIQARVDELRLAFAGQVAEGRDGKISLDQVLATEAATYMGDEAISLGLIDEIGELEEYMSVFNTPHTANTKPLGSQLSASAEDAQASTVAAVKQRVKAITMSDAAKGRASLAQHLAFNTELSVEAAVNALKAAPSTEVTAVAKPAAKKLSAEERGAKAAARLLGKAPRTETNADYNAGAAIATALLSGQPLPASLDYYNSAAYLNKKADDDASKAKADDEDCDPEGDDDDDAICDEEGNKIDVASYVNQSAFGGTSSRVKTFDTLTADERTQAQAGEAIAQRHKNEFSPTK